MKPDHSLNGRTEHMNNTDTAARAIRSWLGIPYASAERFRRPILLPFNPALPYDQKGLAPVRLALALPVRWRVRGRHQPRPAGHHHRAQMGAGEHRPLRWRPSERHRHRPQRRRVLLDSASRSPAADGLYQRLAAFSGGASRIVPAWWAEELAIKFLTELGIADDPEQLLTLMGSSSPRRS